MLWNTGEDKMISGLLLSFQFFTRIPVNKAIELDKKNIRNAIFFLPFVGALIGLIAAIIYYILSPYSNLIAGLFSISSMIIITGGLHIDGLSDTFDGFMANKDRERTFEIMKDSRVGAFGVLSIILLILFKYVFIISFNNGFFPILLSLINSRVVLSYIISYKKVAKTEGLGYLFNGSNPKVFSILTLLIYVVVLAITNTWYLFPLALTIATAEIICKISYKKIGGLTGDVYGSIVEIGEVLSLLGFWSVVIWT